MQHASVAVDGPNIILPTVLDRASIVALLPELRRAIAAGPVRIDGAGVERVGQAGLQLLLSTRRSAAAGTVVVGSAALHKAAAFAGLERALDLAGEEAAA